MKNFTLLFIILMNVQSSLGQGCCGAGSSMVSAGIPSLVKNTLFFQVGGDYSSTKNSNTQLKASGNASVGFGITNHFSVYMRANYQYLTYDILQRGLHFENYDFGDGNVGLQFSVLPMDAINKQDLRIGTDFTIPWGPSEKEKNEVILPENVQSGKGAFGFGGFISYTKNFPIYYLGYSTSLAGKINLKNSRDEELSDEIGLLNILSIGPFHNAHALLMVNYKYLSSKLSFDGTPIPYTKGNRIDFAPAVEYSFTEKVSTNLQVEFPLWRDKDQEKSGTNLGIRLSNLFYLGL